MLSKKSEKFLKEFRIEMMARGKDDEARDEMEEELKDHLILAEKNGEYLESVTGGSVQSYIKTLSDEMPETNHLRRNMILLFTFLIGMFTIPRLISGEFDYTASQFLYYMMVAVIGPLLFYTAVKFVFIHYTSLENEKIDKKGISLIVIYSVLNMALLVGGIYLVNIYPVYEFFQLSSQTNMLIGVVLLGIFMISTIMMKQWFYTFLIFALSLPELIAQYFVGGGPGDENYLIVSGILLTVVSIAIIGVLTLYSKKSSKKEIE